MWHWPINIVLTFTIIIMRYHLLLDVALAQLLSEYLSAAYKRPGAATNPLETFRMEYWHKKNPKKKVK